MSTSKRSYGQFCGASRARYVVGERWTLLIVRELVLGPRRYKDLGDALTGIGTNLLAARLRDLEAAELVQRRKLPAPAGSTVYELTALGRELEPIVFALGRWGRKLLAPELGDQRFNGRWLLFALRANFVASQAAGVDECYELRVGDDTTVHAYVHDGGLEVGEGPATDPDLVVTAPLDVLLALTRGDTTPAKERKAGRLVLEGTRAAFERFWTLFDGAGLPAGAPPPASGATALPALPGPRGRT